MNSRQILCLAMIVLIAFSYSFSWANMQVLTFGQSAYQSTTEYSIQNPQSITANYTYSITPTEASPSITVHLLQSFSYLNVTKTMIFVNPKRMYSAVESTDEFGNRIMTMRFQSMRVRERFAVTILQHATAYSIRFGINPERVGSYDKTSLLYKVYTSPAKYIESNHPEIISASKQIIGNETNPYLIAQKIFYFVVHHVRRDWSLTAFNPDTEGALFALRTGRGVCRHFSALFTALARASGVPTVMIWGSWGIGDVDKHDWVHFYLPNYGWIPIETTAGDSLDNVDRWFAQIPDNIHIPVIFVNYVYWIAQGSGCELQSLVPREAPFISQGTRIPLTATYQHASILEYVRMQKRALQVTVDYDAEDEKWAWYVSDLAHRSLPRLEELAGFPYPHDFNVTIYIQEGENNYNLYEKGIYLIPKTWDFAILHELAHYWTSIYGVGDRFGKRWLQEAFATLIPAVLFEEWGDVAKSLEVRGVHLRWFHQYFSKHEQPLDVWKGENVKEVHDFLYGKTYCFIYILYREFGIQILQNVNLQICKSGKVADSMVFKETLERISGKDLNDIFSGWVFGSSYLKYGPEDFRDSDNDGLLSVDERINGTDPNNPDTDGDGVKDGVDPHSLDPMPENAFKLLGNVEAAIRRAEQEGRTQGLDMARQKLAAAQSAYDSSQYDTAIFLANEALELAEKATVPTITTATTTTATLPTQPNWLQANWSYVAVLAIVIAIAIILVTRKLRRKRGAQADEAT